MEIVLDIKDLNFSYGNNTVFDQFNMTIKSGEVVGLMGPNGAGKSTLFQLIMGNLKPASGTILLNGEKISFYNLWRDSFPPIGYVPQDIKLFPSLSVVEHLKLLHQNENMSLEKVVENFDLGDMLSHAISMLSLFQKKKLVLACAVMMSSTLIIIDEITSGLDKEDISNIQNMLIRVRSTIAILMIEHHNEFITSFADRVVILS
jgi:ABC-type multidrug transport system ATPase subunit